MPNQPEVSHFDTDRHPGWFQHSKGKSYSHGGWPIPFSFKNPMFFLSNLFGLVTIHQEDFRKRKRRVKERETYKQRAENCYEDKGNK